MWLQTVNHTSWAHLKIILFIYFWLCWVFTAVWVFISPSMVSQGYSLVMAHGLLIEIASLVEHGL